MSGIEHTIQPQEDFDRMIALLRPFAEENALVAQLLQHYPIAKVSFHWNADRYDKPNWEGVLDTYRHRARFSAEREDGPFVFGWESLMPALEQTQHRFISITDFTTTIGSFIVFTDAKKTSFIGLLRSNRALGDKQLENETHGIYFHNGEVSSYSQWFLNGIWVQNEED
jgi:hypothetical protein